jgi:CRP-like cAMP-binding protein
MVDPFYTRRILALRQFSLFASAEVGELAMLADAVAEVSFRAGTVVAEAGRRVAALHLILAGRIDTDGRGVAAAGSGPGGGAAEVRSIATTSWGPRQIFGTLEVLARRELATRAIAARDTRALQLQAGDVTEVLDENFGVLRATVQELAAHVLARARRRRSAPGASIDGSIGLVDRLVLLRHQPVFEAARIDALASLAHAAEELRLPPGSVVARAGELATGIVLIGDGALHARRADLTTRTLGPGDAIGALETLAEVGHVETVEATTPVRALKLAGSAIYDVLEDHTDLGLSMIGSFAATLYDAGLEPAPAAG